MVNVLDLFSGIGGFSLGFERAGMRTVAFCESDEFCRQILAKHWPNVPIYDDVRSLTAERLQANGIAVEVICGGFPCQDISVAGKGAGIAGERSGLWSEFARIIGEVRPHYVIVENVSALLGRGIGRVLGDLAALGFDAEWHCIPASAVGAPHRRDRIWIVAHATRNVRGEPAQGGSERERVGASSQSEFMADPTGQGLEGWEQSQAPWAAQPQPSGKSGMANPYGRPLLGSAIAWPKCHPWLTEPDVGRVANGVSARVDRLRALGNAVVPQIVEIIGRAIMKAEQHT